jgi:IS5 family transposase
MVRAAQPQWSFTDLEMNEQAVGLDDVMQALSDFIDQQHTLLDLVHQDLVRGLKNPETGRGAMNASQVLRSFVLRRVKNWDLRELRERIADGYSLRRFTTFYSEPVPSHRAFHRAFKRLSPQTLRRLNEVVVQAAVELGVEDGKKLRVDTTVVQTDIHHPSDSSLLWDAVRVITRGVKKLGQVLPEVTRDFHDRSRRAHRRSVEISRMEKADRPRQQKRKYRDLVKVTEQTIAQARQVVDRAAQVKVVDLFTAEKIQVLREEVVRFCELGLRVIEQTRRRVFDGENVPVAEKIFSLFETHTDLIKRGKVITPVEFGHKVFVAESARGLITDYRVLSGNPADDQQVAPSLKHHKQMFGAAPELYSADRGFHSLENVKSCEQAGVQTVCLPQRGGQKTAERHAVEHSTTFKRGQRFRAGIEGRISVLMRGRGMKRCPDEGLESFEVFVGAAVLANNLLRIACLLSKTKRARQRRAKPTH